MTEPKEYTFGYFPRNKYKDLIFYVKGYQGKGYLNYGLFEMPDTEENRALMEALANPPRTPAPETKQAYRNGYDDGAKAAREQFTFADAIETFCYIDIYQYFDETRDVEDISKCKGKECNYCGKFNEESLRTQQQNTSSREVNEG